MRDIAFFIAAFCKVVGWTLALIVIAILLPFVIIIRIIQKITERNTP